VCAVCVSCLSVSVFGYWVVGLLGCWVVGLWVVGLLLGCCWVVGLLGWKVSIDGKLFGNDDVKMVVVGLTPLGFEGVAVQSCYAVFPVALVCGTEKSEDLEMKLGKLWELMKELMERGEVTMPNGKKHKYDFIVVTDLAACWNLYVFAGFNRSCNCPYCMSYFSPPSY